MKKGGGREGRKGEWDKIRAFIGMGGALCRRRGESYFYRVTIMCEGGRETPNLVTD